MGLAITDSLVELMGGKIMVHSAMNQGSSFEIQLPRHVQEDETVQSQSSCQSGHLY